MRTIATTMGVLDQFDGSANSAFQLDSRLQELSQGIMEGQPRNEVCIPETVAEMLEDPMHFAFPEGESFIDMQKRMSESYDDLVAKYRGNTVLVVGHGLAIRSFCRAISGLEPR